MMTGVHPDASQKCEKNTFHTDSGTPKPMKKIGVITLDEFNGFI